MEIIPAIDIKNGSCVRLYQGDFNRQTLFSDDPIEVAQRWKTAGATRIHIVDLDGSRTGLQINLDIIKSINYRTNVPLQVGGGIRDLKTAHTLLNSGIDRVVLGTAAIENPDMIQHLCKIWGSERVVVALDAREERIAIKGWIKETSVSVSTLATQMANIGVQRFLYTDISRDGTMTSPNFEGVRKLVVETNKSILASGGVSSLKDLEKLSNIGAEGVILGSALYKGDICLEEAISIVDQGQ